MPGLKLLCISPPPFFFFWFVSLSLVSLKKNSNTTKGLFHCVLVYGMLLLGRDACHHFRQFLFICLLHKISTLLDRKNPQSNLQKNKAIKSVSCQVQTSLLVFFPLLLNSLYMLYFIVKLF